LIGIFQILALVTAVGVGSNMERDSQKAPQVA
jgi:hypothetical protein